MVTMHKHALPLFLAGLAVLPAGASSPRRARTVSAGSGKTYIYTYYDKSGRIVINNLPPAFVREQGLVLKHVGIAQVRLAITQGEMARVLKSPEMLAMVDEISAANGVDTFLARAIIQAESAFNYKARSRAGALGLMQLMPATAERFGVLDPFDPRQNITGGVKYLKWLSDYYAGDLRKVVAAYNAGEGAVNRHNGIPPFRETMAYVPRVLDLYQRKAVQADPNAAGSMSLLKKGRGGFDVEEKPLAADEKPIVQANTRIYQWMDPSGRMRISDQPPPRGTAGVKVFGG